MAISADNITRGNKLNLIDEKENGGFPNKNLSKD